MDKSGRNAARGALLAPLLLLGPLVIALDRLDVAGELTLFVLAGLALIPLSWLIGEATDNLALHTGPGIGGFLNATFGNAPELIIAIVAIADGLTEIVRASLVGSVAGNLLLVLGFTLLFGRKGAIDLQSAYVSLGLVGFATVLVLVAAVPGFHGNPDRRSLAELSLPIAALLLIVRVTVTRRALRRQRQLQASAEVEDGGWPLPAALVVLGLATVVTALLTETLVGTLRAFAQTAHLSEFFVAVVIVRDRRQRDGARERGAAGTPGKGQARRRDSTGLERADRRLADPAGRARLVVLRAARSEPSGPSSLRPSASRPSSPRSFCGPGERADSEGRSSSPLTRFSSLSSTSPATAELATGSPGL